MYDKVSIFKAHLVWYYSKLAFFKFSKYLRMIFFISQTAIDVFSIIKIVTTESFHILSEVAQHYSAAVELTLVSSAFWTGHKQISDQFYD